MREVCFMFRMALGFQGRPPAAGKSQLTACSILAAIDRWRGGASFSDHFQQRFKGRGFDHVEIETSFDDAGFGILVAPCRESDQQRLGKRRVRPHTPRHFKAIHDRHAKVQKNDMRFEARRRP